VEYAVNQVMMEDEEVADAVLKRVREYWRTLGLSDEVLIDSLSADCLIRGRRLVSRTHPEELLRRALEEAQRRFDHALAAAFGLPPSNDPYPLAAARAAFLMAPNISADTLFRHDETTRQLRESLAGQLPQSTPPESPLEMLPVPLDFWLFQSTDR